MARPMGDSHRRFLQTMMSNGIIDGSQAKALHKHCCEVAGANYSQDRLDEFVDVINMHLQPMFMHVRKGMSEEDGLQYYALVNLAETDVTRMSSDYADNELELFRKIMDLVAESENGTASSTDILNCGDALLSKKLKKKETEQVLNKFVQNKWLTEKHGEYSLSTRCIMEMEQYMRTLYQDLIKDCHVCHNIAFQCQMCENPDCGIRMHLPCVARYFKGRSDPHCPACNEFWPHEIPEIHRPPASQSQPLSAKENTAPSSTPSTSRARRSSRRL
ncbi:non-structural maintenance of chromosomes element 1 homolog [Alosa sapidissima]|uniref:non-structural maintenance of chromosomes element 1 homolog n=1 Tax=Alosa sapidissima TaxID=34773 RepID=UPI001C08BC4C|nr:non-structural maintenance of chromosomes element 1 homolog [Alosa sapidissima]XP_041943352.1 non-structural maintenance of chromosomes element 1 homolog [Alosa sapidissima]